MKIPGLYNKPFHGVEWRIYCTVLEDINGEHCDDTIAFWNKIQDHTSQLSLITRRYLSISVNSVDAERSFRANKNVVNNKCHSVTDDNTNYLVG